MMTNFRSLIGTLTIRSAPVVRWVQTRAVWYRWGLGVVVCLGLGFGAYRMWFLPPKVISPAGASLGITEVTNTKPMVIVFDHPLKPETLTYEIHPELAGHWKVHSRPFIRTASLTFTPTESPDLDTRYTIALAGIRGLGNSHTEKYLLSFQTDTMPVLQSASPAADAVDVLPDSPIVLTFDKPVSDGIALEATLTPEMALETPTITDNIVTFTHATQLLKSTSYGLKVTLSTAKYNYATQVRTVSEEKNEIVSSAFTTIAAPGIQTYSPQGTSVDAATTVELTFKQAMDKESTQAAFTLAPAAAGAFTWTDDTKLIFTPSQPLTKGQAYTVTVANTAKAASGFTPDEVFSYSFTTIGAVSVASFTPRSGTTNVDPGTTVSVVFNQAVVPASAESKFSLAPATAGTFTWDANTLTFHPGAALAYGTAYTATIAAGVQTVHGLDSVSVFSTKFTTRNQSIMLKVPAYVQSHVYSCMISAARSALAFRGVNVSEASIISKVGRDTTPWSGTWGGSNGVWGDPESDIVGPLDNGAATSPAGKKTTNVYWGYGSHWGPIAAALTSYGVSNEVRQGMSVQDLAQSLTDGNPVIIWWVNGIWPSYAVNWKTPSGKQIRGVNGLHVQVVRGFTGNVSNPISFTVTDSGYGYPGRTYDVGTFKAKWGWFGNTGIIVK